MRAPKLLLLAALLACALAAAAAEGKDWSRGWNDKIEWHPLQEGRELAQKLNKPIMCVLPQRVHARMRPRRRVARASHRPLALRYLIHKTWCSACKRLKPVFAASQVGEAASAEHAQELTRRAAPQPIEQMSKHFVMINIEDDEEPDDPTLKPDGGYVPRILFATPDNRVSNGHFNREGNEKYKYFYSTATQIMNTMSVAARDLKNGPPRDKEL
jgi:protein-disulfide reductase (glutathione)